MSPAHNTPVTAESGNRMRKTSALQTVQFHHKFTDADEYISHNGLFLWAPILIFAVFTNATEMKYHTLLANNWFIHWAILDKYDRFAVMCAVGIGIQFNFRNFPSLGVPKTVAHIQR